MSTEPNVISPIGRLSFPNLFTPVMPMNGVGDPKYDCVVLFDAKTDLSALKAEAHRALKEKWGDKIPPGLRSPFRDGNEKQLDGYSGCIYVRFSSKRRPGVVDENVQPVIDPSLIYAGCYVRVSCRAYAFDTSGNKGIAFGLQNIQKVKEGEPFGGGASSAEADFAPIGKTAQASAPVAPIAKRTVVHQSAAPAATPHGRDDSFEPPF